MGEDTGSYTRVPGTVLSTQLVLNKWWLLQTSTRWPQGHRRNSPGGKDDLTQVLSEHLEVQTSPQSWRQAI